MNKPFELFLNAIPFDFLASGGLQYSFTREQCVFLPPDVTCMIFIDTMGEVSFSLWRDAPICGNSEIYQLETVTLDDLIVWIKNKV